MQRRALDLSRHQTIRRGRRLHHRSLPSRDTRGRRFAIRGDASQCRPTYHCDSDADALYGSGSRFIFDCCRKGTTVLSHLKNHREVGEVSDDLDLWASSKTLAQCRYWHKADLSPAVLFARFSAGKTDSACITARGPFLTKAYMECCRAPPLAFRGEAIRSICPRSARYGDAL